MSCPLTVALRGAALHPVPMLAIATASVVRFPDCGPKHVLTNPHALIVLCETTRGWGLKDDCWLSYHVAGARACVRKPSMHAILSWR